MLSRSILGSPQDFDSFAMRSKGGRRSPLGDGQSKNQRSETPLSLPSEEDEASLGTEVSEEASSVEVEHPMDEDEYMHIMKMMVTHSANVRVHDVSCSCILE